jgi:hypothetical protein
MPPEFRAIVPCHLGPDVTCEAIERIHRTLVERDKLLGGHLFGLLNPGIQRNTEAIDALRGRLAELLDRIEDHEEKETTGQHVFAERITRNEAIAARGQAIAEAALEDTARLGARKGRRKGQLETTLVTLLGIIVYGVAKHYGLPLP